MAESEVVDFSHPAIQEKVRELKAISGSFFESLVRREKVITVWAVNVFLTAIPKKYLTN